MESTEKNNEAPPAAGHGKMPVWLFFFWVALTLWGIYYIGKYAMPDLKDWSGRPLPTTYERP